MGAGALAILLAATSPAAGRATLPLVEPPHIARDVAALPRLARPASPAERRIDATLAAMNRAMPKVIRTCRTLSSGPAASGAYWSRKVETTLAGPRFLSLAVTDDYFCGGAHPDTAREALVFDLSTGRLADWRSFLSPALTGKVSLQEGADGVKTQRLASRRLHALYLAGYGATDQGGNPDCREAVTNPPDDPPPASVWPTTKGFGVQFDVAHVAEACALPVVIPAARLKAAGAAPALLAAMEAPKR